jgi:hypothetical protein
LGRVLFLRARGLLNFFFIGLVVAYDRMGGWGFGHSLEASLLRINFDFFLEATVLSF